MMENLFGENFAGVHTGQGGRNRKSKSRNEERSYEVTLEDSYKGKTTRFASTRTVTCSTCQGSGGKAKARLQKCSSCDGKGMEYNSSVIFSLTVSKVKETSFNMSRQVWLSGLLSPAQPVIALER